MSGRKELEKKARKRKDGKDIYDCQLGQSQVMEIKY